MRLWKVAEGASDLRAKESPRGRGSVAGFSQVRTAMLATGVELLDPPADYSGKTGYGQGYYAAYYADPDG